MTSSVVSLVWLFILKGEPAFDWLQQPVSFGSSTVQTLDYATLNWQSNNLQIQIALQGHYCPGNEVAMALHAKFSYLGEKWPILERLQLPQLQCNNYNQL